jgi:hypothetical protein
MHFRRTLSPSLATLLLGTFAVPTSAHFNPNAVSARTFQKKEKPLSGQLGKHLQGVASTRKGSSMGDCRKCQTSTATPAEPGELLGY